MVTGGGGAPICFRETQLCERHSVRARLVTAGHPGRNSSQDQEHCHGTVLNPHILNPASPPTRPPLQSQSVQSKEGSSHPHRELTRSATRTVKRLLGPGLTQCAVANSDDEGGSQPPTRQNSH